MMDGVVSVATTLYGIEHELVPFCGLGRKRMYEVDETYDLLVDAKHRVAAVLKKCLEGPQALLEEYEGYSFLLTETLPADGVKAMGKTGEIKVVAFDAPTRIVDDLKSGYVDLAIAQHPAEIGYMGVMVAYGHVTGNPVPVAIGTGFTVMTADNIDDPNISKYVYSD
jgi:hypothetical protein